MLWTIVWRDTTVRTTFLVYSVLRAIRSFAEEYSFTCFYSCIRLLNNNGWAGANWEGLRNAKLDVVILDLKELKEIFMSIDTDGSNTLTLSEVVLFLKSITDDLSESNIEKIFTSIDTSDDKSIDFKEFKVNKHFKQISLDDDDDESADDG